MATPWFLDPALQPGVGTTAGSDLYKQRVAANTAHGIPGGGVSGAMGNVGGLETGMASFGNMFMSDQARGQYERNLPGYTGMVGQRNENIQDQLEGKVQDDVIIQLLNNAARFGISSGAGAGGGPAQNSNFLRNLGLTSIGQMEAGSKNLSAAIADTPTAEMWNPLNFWQAKQLGQMEFDAAKLAETGRRQGDMGTDWWQQAGGMTPLVNRFTSPSGQFL